MDNPEHYNVNNMNVFNKEHLSKLMDEVLEVFSKTNSHNRVYRPSFAYAFFSICNRGSIVGTTNISPIPVETFEENIDHLL